eukprot:scaffold10678_cov92-Isochrysis_galbana.AAC.7
MRASTAGRSTNGHGWVGAEWGTARQGRGGLWFGYRQGRLWFRFGERGHRAQHPMRAAFKQVSRRRHAY